MKNTKNYLNTGIVLTIGLFSSIQLFSMESNIASLTKRIERLEFNQNSLSNSVMTLENPEREINQQKTIINLLKNTFVEKSEFIATVRLIAEQINHAGKMLNVLGTLFVDMGILTMAELQQRILNSIDKAVGLKMAQ